MSSTKLLSPTITSSRAHRTFSLPSVPFPHNTTLFLLNNWRVWCQQFIFNKVSSSSSATAVEAEASAGSSGTSSSCSRWRWEAGQQQHKKRHNLISFFSHLRHFIVLHNVGRAINIHNASKRTHLHYLSPLFAFPVSYLLEASMMVALLVIVVVPPSTLLLTAVTPLLLLLLLLKSNSNLATRVAVPVAGIRSS